jgi:hypothetical protein
VSLAIHGSPSWPKPPSPPTLSLSPSCSANSAARDDTYQHLALA